MTKFYLISLLLLTISCGKNSEKPAEVSSAKTINSQEKAKIKKEDKKLKEQNPSKLDDEENRNKTGKVTLSDKTISDGSTTTTINSGDSTVKPADNNKIPIRKRFADQDPKVTVMSSMRGLSPKNSGATLGADDKKTTQETLGKKSTSASAFGTINPRLVRATILKHKSEVQNCYKRTTGTSKDIRGKVIVKFNIVNGGKAKGCKVTQHLSSPQIGYCICKRIRKWQFPNPGNTTAKFSHSWDF
jgi:hypothetical protein